MILRDKNSVLILCIMVVAVFFFVFLARVVVVWKFSRLARLMCCFFFFLSFAQEDKENTDDFASSPASLTGQFDLHSNCMPGPGKWFVCVCVCARACSISLHVSSFSTVSTWQFHFVAYGLAHHSSTSPLFFAVR